MRFRSWGALGAFAVLGALMLAVSASGADISTEKQTYIVQMLESPVVAYEGGTAGLAATKPAKGQKIDPNSAAVKKYAAYLVSQHDAALQKVGGAAKLYDYNYTYNGFAAKLTAGQKAALEKQAGVLAVSAEETVTADTSSTPTFLGLTAPGGLWEQLGGPTAGKSGVGAGENVVIGVVDSGIWPESKSFSDRNSAGQLIYQQIPGWNGKCTPGEGFNASMCNQKLIGGQHFNASWGGDAALEAQRPWEFTSVRDYNGHGTHTASTAGGNNGVAATGPAAIFGTVSGMAPRARISAYKALWSTQDASTASGLTGDLVAAIDQAVADGVDVINYSISGSQTNFADPVMVSFLFAADAGVFVAASAGNSGPTTSTVAHPSPWMTTVAAGTHNRDGKGSVTLGNGATYNGASVATPIGPKPFIDSTAASLPGADATLVALCYGAGDNGGTPVLDPAKVAGKIVLCDRGVTGRVNKSLAVQQAGGVGMILVNTSANSLNADFHFVPTVHLSHLDRPGVESLRGHGRRDGDDQRLDDRLRRRRSVDGVVLLPRPAACGWRRHAEAGRDRSGSGHPGRGRASGERRSRLQPAQRHLDVEPARGRPRGTADPQAPGLVADDGQVGADDDRIGRPRRRHAGSEHQSGADLPAGCGPRAAEQAPPTRASSTTAASTTGWPSCAGRRRPSTRPRAPR